MPRITSIRIRHPTKGWYFNQPFVLVVMPSEAHFQVLRCIEQNPEMSQREISAELGISLGKTNYCVRALIQRGWIKAHNFKNSQKKLAYAYTLTPQGIEQKSKLALLFLRQKQAEFDALKLEIEKMCKEVGQISK